MMCVNQSNFLGDKLDHLVYKTMIDNVDDSRRKSTPEDVG